MDRQLALGNSKIVFRPTLKLQIYRLSIFFFSVENTAKMSSPVIPIPAKMVEVAVSTAPAQLISAPSQPPETGAAVYTYGLVSFCNHLNLHLFWNKCALI